ncbi:ParA family protein [Nostoc sp. LEGE 12447]|uniref:ParA family protein n=1 Tax=Nostoc sp. LEGE 12447 TaxID=1828640 RepID=UPI0018845C45|nr:ParA family protein [Nostoc sp. LEGE 12447]MBE9003344.1 ParA family protein [Nostoc sp. LEGE 12447]
MIIGLTNQKGGAGKTTIAGHLAYWLSQRGTVIVVDADAQQSSTNWMKDLQLPCKTMIDPDDLFDELPTLAEQYSAVVVDGPGSLSETTKAILSRCDLALVPCKPSGLDMHSTSKMVRILRQARELRGGMPNVGLFLNQAKKGTVLLKDAQRALDAKNTGFPLLKSMLFDLQVIADAPGQGTTVWGLGGATAKRAAQDFEALFTEALEVANVKK